MTGQIVAFRSLPTTDERDALLAAIVDLHALITLDPVLGVSPVRIYFVLNPQALNRIAECLDSRDRARKWPPGAYALIAYDFPFALHLVESNLPSISAPRGQEIISRSAGLQGDALQAAADASGIQADPVPSFSESALKTAFFPNTQETVTHLFRLTLRSNP